MAETASRPYVLDAFAVVAMVFGEPGEAQVTSILNQAAHGQAQVAMSLVNWGEMLYIVERRRGRLQASEIAEWLDAVPVGLVQVDREFAERAARFKVAGRMSYADCYAAALAQMRSGVLVTGDEEFRALENELQIEWLPQRPHA